MAPSAMLRRQDFFNTPMLATLSASPYYSFINLKWRATVVPLPCRRASGMVIPLPCCRASRTGTGTGKRLHLYFPNIACTIGMCYSRCIVPLGRFLA